MIIIQPDHFSDDTAIVGLILVLIFVSVLYLSIICCSEKFGKQIKQLTAEQRQELVPSHPVDFKDDPVGWYLYQQANKVR